MKRIIKGLLCATSLGALALTSCGDLTIRCNSITAHNLDL